MEVSERYPSVEALGLAIVRDEVRWRGSRAPNHWLRYRQQLIKSERQIPRLT